MRSRRVVLQWAGVALLGLAALTAIALVWPASRDRIEIPLSGERLRDGWAALGASSAPDPQLLPDLMLAVDRPNSMLLGREERLGLTIERLGEPASPAVYSVEVELAAWNALAAPPGQTAQVLRGGTSFEWTMVAMSAPEASATLLVRLRRHSDAGAPEAERLVLARDLVLPVRTIVGLSAPAARVAAAVMGLAGTVLGIGSLRTRRR